MGEVVLYDGTEELHFAYGRGRQPFMIEEAGLEGWRSHPDTKTNLTEKASGHGAFPVTADQLLYSARTVTVHLAEAAASRDEMVSAMERINRFGGQVCRLRVVDSDDTFVTGYLRSDNPAEWEDRGQKSSFTFVAPDPRRYSWQQQKSIMLPPSSGDGGLRFGDDGQALEFPIAFGVTTPVQNVCTLTNAGNSPAFPVLQVSGPLNNVTVTWAGKTLAFGQPIGSAGLTLDSLTRTARVGSLDQSQFLTSRDFPVIAPGGSVTLALVSSGRGWVTATVRDTWI